VLAEECKDVMRFLPIEFLNALDERWIVVQGLEASYRMGSDLLIMLIMLPDEKSGSKLKNNTYQRVGCGYGCSVWCSASVYRSYITSLRDS
jgi:hypothetical protein